MKRLNLIPLALTTLMLGACSSEDGLNMGSGSSVAQGEKGYISFSLNLPTTSGVANRAANDEFVDGTTGEYGVSDAELLLFTGADEANAKFAGAYKLSGVQTGTPVGGNITTTHKIIQQITNPTEEGSSNKIYAMVVVNGIGSSIVQAPTEESPTSGWTVNGVSLTPNTKYADLAQSEMTMTDGSVSSITADDNFLMLNAPLYSKQGGLVSAAPTGGTLQTLTEINPNNIFPTQAQAEANPAANVYVERAVAKVTVTNNSTGTGSAPITSYVVNGWTLDVTNTRSYLVHQFDNSWVGYTATNPATPNYRFVGSVPVAANLYRTYWGKDPNYTGYAGSDFNKLEKTTPSVSSLKKTTDVGYCLENTFDISSQNENQTTRVVIAATLEVENAEEGSGDFYVLNGNKDVIYTKTKVDDEIKKAYLSNSKVIAELKDEETGLQDDKTSLTGNDLEVEYTNKNNTQNNGGYLEVATVKIKDVAAVKFKKGIPNALNPAATSGYDASIVTDINSQYNIAYYKGGVAYYPVKIKHFGDDLTPWDSGAYGSNYGQYLGRYGVLRNNWYEIQVNSIKSIGDPEVPEVFGNQDDPEQSWISVSINVLSWAKRSQEVDL